MFWTDDRNNRIWMARLNGTGATLLISTGLSCPGQCRQVIEEALNYRITAFLLITQMGLHGIGSMRSSTGLTLVMMSLKSMILPPGTAESCSTLAPTQTTETLQLIQPLGKPVLSVLNLLISKWLPLAGCTGLTTTRHYQRSSVSLWMERPRPSSMMQTYLLPMA